MWRNLALAASLWSATLLVHAQLAPPGFGTGISSYELSRQGDETVSITGVFRGVDGAPVTDCRIELRNVMGSRVALVTTGPSGTFAFHGVPSGLYEVVAISGLDSANQRLHVRYGEEHVSLVLNRSARDQQGAATVSVAEFRIPTKARAELQKAQQELARHKLQEARTHVDRALALAPEYAQALTLRGILKLEEH
jgi:hypothetical protein